MEKDDEQQAIELAADLKAIVQRLLGMGRNDLVLKAIGVQTLEVLRIEAAKGTLRRLVITPDYRFLLGDKEEEVLLSPVHKAVYVLFLNHPEGIEFKNLASYRQELFSIYEKMASRMDLDKIRDTVERLTNPLDNAINEKCSRIKAAFAAMMDEYSVNYYMISSHTSRLVEGSNKMWFRRLKLITLPRNLVTMPDELCINPQRNHSDSTSRF